MIKKGILRRYSIDNTEIRNLDLNGNTNSDLYRNGCQLDLFKKKNTLNFR